MKRALFVLLIICLFGFLSEQPKVYLNHVYITLDKSSFQAVAQSAFLKERFSEIRQATITADSNQTWTGFYLFGKNTYIEIFEEAPGQETGMSAAIAFGVDRTGDFDKLTLSLATSRNWRSEFKNRTRNFGGQDIPWFKSFETRFSEGPAEFRCWVMEYERSYMDSVVAKALKRDPAGDVSRAFYNARVYDSKKLFGDITEISISLDESHFKKVTTLFQAFGYDVTHHDHSEISYQGPGIVINVTPSKLENRITSIRINLNLDYCGDTIYFGEKNAIAFDCNRKQAVWNF